MKTRSYPFLLLAASLLVACKSVAPEPIDTTLPVSVSPAEVFQGQYGIASDPSVIRDESVYRMSYTGYDPTTDRTVICQATSPDGLAWKNVAVTGNVEGQMVRGITGTWQERLEGSCLLKISDVYHLYCSGYRNAGDPAPGFPAALGLATSSDGIKFTMQPDPLLEPTSGWYDNDAIYSPSIIRTVRRRSVYDWAYYRSFLSLNRTTTPLG